MKNQFDDLLQRRMDRKDFLKTAGFGIVMMTGAASLMKAFYQPEKQVAANANSKGMTYGSSVYGGVKHS